MNISPTGLLAVAYGDAAGNTSSYNRRTKAGSTMLEIDTWYHIAVVIVDATDMTFYLDCIVDEGTYSGTGGSIGYTDCQGSIGRKDADINAPPYYFKGTLDDFRYWDRALTLIDIDTLCNVLTSSDENINFARNEFIVYPNPTVDFLTIKTNFTSLNSITIHNLLGKLVYSGPFKTSLDISHLTSGMYILKAFGSTNMEEATRRFIVE